MTGPDLSVRQTRRSIARLTSDHHEYVGLKALDQGEGGMLMQNGRLLVRGPGKLGATTTGQPHGQQLPSVSCLVTARIHTSGQRGTIVGKNYRAAKD